MNETNKELSLNKMNTMNKSNNVSDIFDIENDQYIEPPWTIIESYFRGQHLERLVRHQLESYNNFVGYQIIKTIEMFNPVHIVSEQDLDPVSNKYSLEIYITFENFNIYRPQIHENNGAIKLMFPQEARLRNFTYASSMTVDINIKYIVRTGSNLENTQTFYKTLPKIHIGKLPIMLKSNICILSQYKHVDHTHTGECKFDAGGYFIINGSEKTVLGQERAAENKVYCFNVSKNNTKFNWMAEIKSVPDFKCISPKQINMMISSKNNGFGNAIYLQLPRVKQPIPLFIVFRALGVISDKEICEKIILNLNEDEKMLEALQASVIEANKTLTQDECIKYITTHVMYTPINMDKETGSRKKLEFTMDILSNDLFPHCQNTVQKIYFLGYMANKLLRASFEIVKTDDRDSYVNKRIDLTGSLLNNLFRNYFNKLVKDMEKQIIREINNGSWKSKDDYENIINMTNIYKIVKSTTIENGLKRALATGDFGIKHTNSNKVGVAQVLNRLTYVSSLSHARRISTPTDKSGKLIPPRKLHNTSWGFLCLTGDTDVLLSNRIDSKKIKDIKDGDWVNTVNRSSLLDEPSDMYNYFSKMPDKLFEIVTISGRKIKATIDHPFLVKTENGEYKMKKVGELQVNDKVIIRHTVKPIKDENTTIVIINESNVLEHYRLELLELSLLNVEIPINKLKIIARLIGALNTDGHLGITNDEEKAYYNSSFNVGEEYDVYQLVDDIKSLGFGNASIRRRTTKFEDKINGRTTTSSTWEVAKAGSFAYFMYLMGGFVGKKTNMPRALPEWLINAELSIKREFLSAFQGGDGSRLSYQKNDKTFKPSLGITFQTTHNDYLNETTQYMLQIIDLFTELGIKCHLNTNKLHDSKTKVSIVFEKSTENLIRYSDYISYSYCEEKRRTSAPIIEHLKIRGYNKIQRDSEYQYIIDNHASETIGQLIEKTGLTENQIKKVIYNHKKGIKPQNTRFTTDIVYEDFIRDNIVENGCVSVPILSINEIEPELVYDFTTRSENHSFVASSFVVSNCPAETPEGQSVGIVKNLSYMTHVTIYSNSLPLYEYVLPHIIPIDQEGLTSYDMFNKVKVFINGAWVGLTEEPKELFEMLKEKKYKGIINIYTSIVFDYVSKEIRVCNDSGRLSRPLLRVKDQNILLTYSILDKLKKGEMNWNHLLTSSSIEESVLEYIDPEEQSWSMIATKPTNLIQKGDQLYRYTHCEIHPSSIFGILASCIPFPEHNQSPRNTYQCLDINETVLMSNGSKIPIKDVKIGDEVVCFNPETMETSYTKVVNQYVRETDKKIYKIKTLSGREIIATEDHKFMTTEGWCEVRNIIENETKIGILPYQTNQYTVCNNVNETLILSEEQFKEFFLKNRFNLKLIEKYISELKNNDLIPLYNTNYKLPILARIFGFLNADGSINIYERNNNKFTACSFDFGTENDVTSFENDIQICGFNKCKYNKSSRTFNDTTHTTYAVTHNGILPAILLALGISYGKKTENYRKELPLWIMNGSPLIKREFLSGFQGGDGCKIRSNKIDKGYNFICAETSQQINPKYVKTLNKFMSQCVSLFRELDIEVSNVKNVKIEEDRVKVSYKISDKQSNLIKYFDNIGYRYSSTKNNSSFIIIEYLKYKNDLFEKHKKMIEQIRVLYEENNTNTLIANKLNLKVSYVSDVIRSYKNNRKISMRNLKEDTIEDWKDHVSLINNMLFIPIKSVEIMDNCLVSDITVESDNHSFIAGNNFLSSNCAQGKQAMGVFATNYENRMDKTAYVLNYPARPLVDTRIMNMIQLNSIPSGMNVIVAIMTHTGYNQEDSLLFNKGSIDRGLFITTIYHTEKDEDKQKINGDEEIRCKPDASKTKGMKMGNYNKVNSKGVIPENTIVENRDIIISKITPIKENRNDHTKVIKYEDQSKIYRTTEETYIDKNYIDRNGEGYNFAKVRLRTVRKPVIGDKFSSRHGQKGTIGNIIPECDMPFTRNGQKPDIIINPHAIPSRMTIGQLKETVLGKVLVELGLFGDGTSFGEFDVKDICKYLLELGYESHGNELLYNGLTGEQHECSVFMGPVFYQRLKHMVNDKSHSRSIGPMVNLTRQPAEGRSRDGGLRFGEMEKDAMVSHGAARFTRGRMYDASDKYSVHICKKCGLVASYNNETHIHHCRTCDNRSDFAYVEIPYACKLIFQELITMNIAPRVMTTNN
jgi:DNA-directed RNA polymerase beta subunit